MGGGMHDQCYSPSLVAGTRTIVLMGRTGNGKSATGNTILGKPEFNSRASFSGVTSTTECRRTTLANGVAINVIDTPGLFDFKVGAEFISKEIAKCVELANNGIHAVLLVCSVRGRFTEEEAGVIHSLQTFFGPKISDYMIVVFTGGDSIDEDQSLEDFLLSGPEPLQKILQLCKNRYFLVDNKTKDETKKASQLQKLFTLVDKMVEENGGQAYTDDLFSEFKETKEMMEQELAVERAACVKAEKAELKLKETTEMLKQELAVEKAARLKAEKDELKLKETTEMLKQDLEALKRIVKDARKKPKDTVQVVRDGLANLHRVVHQFFANHAANLHRVVHQFFANQAANLHRVVHQFFATSAFKLIGL